MPASLGAHTAGLLAQGRRFAPRSQNLHQTWLSLPDLRNALGPPDVRTYEITLTIRCYWARGSGPVKVG